MTTRISPSPKIQATATRIPEADVSVNLSLTGQSKDAVGQSLLLHPGERGAIALYINNPRQAPFRWTAEISGDVPPAWRCWASQETVVEPQQSFEQYLEFLVPDNFFEQPAAGAGDRWKLNYSCTLEVYELGQSANGQPARRCVATQAFAVQVRPPTPYLKFLPAFYRENDLIGRFLALIEQAFDPTVQTLDTLWAYLDPLTAPEALLPFLAQWVGWPLDQRWNLKQQRHLIRNAITLYRWHGTRHGLRFYLHLYTGLPLDDHLPEVEKHIQIEEVFGYGMVLGSAMLGHDALLGGGRPFHFVVRLRGDRQHIDTALVHQIIQQQKPAFCTYDLQFIEGI
jgi:phage tail-like protein